jgi:hypothetical protein
MIGSVSGSEHVHLEGKLYAASVAAYWMVHANQITVSLTSCTKK